MQQKPIKKEILPPPPPPLPSTVLTPASTPSGTDSGNPTPAKLSKSGPSTPKRRARRNISGTLKPAVPPPRMLQLTAAATAPPSASSSLSSGSSSSGTSTPRRPPAAPPSEERGSAESGRVVQALDADLVAIALLSAEARRRSGLMMRERDYVWLHGGRASPLLLSRVRMLEKDVRGIVKTIAKTRARVSAAYCAARFPSQMAR